MPPFVAFITPEGEFDYHFAKGTAMNPVASAVFTCMSTLFLPVALAETSGKRTVVGGSNRLAGNIEDNVACF